MKSEVYVAATQDPYKGACEALDAVGFSVKNRKVFIKPNCTGALPSSQGLTIDTGIVRAVLERLVDCPVVTIGESCGNADKAFDLLGYGDLIKSFPNVKLLDMRNSTIVWKKIPRPYHTRQMPFAAEIFGHDYVINIAKLKTHSLAGVTLCMKNIFGFVPTRKQKLMYHPFIKTAVLDMNQIVRSDFCVVDAVWGNEFDEIRSAPVNVGAIVAGGDMLSVDKVAASLMGIDAGSIESYRLALELFGGGDAQVRGCDPENLRKKFKRGCLPSTRLRYIKEATQSLCYRAMNRH
jgi:uncharacterized protein (DUF362 family)